MAKKKTKFKLTTATALIIAVVVLIIVIAFGASGQTAKFFAFGFICRDSDGGVNPRIGGTCSDIHGSYTDSCPGQTSIAEQSCMQNSCVTKLIKCNTTCKTDAKGQGSCR